MKMGKQVLISTLFILFVFSYAFAEDKKKADGECGKELYEEVKTENIEKLKKLIAKKCDINYINKEEEGLTPLMKAITDKHPDIAVLLLENGADPNIRVNETTPLILAIFGQQEEIVKLLVEKGADVNFKRPGGITALNAAKATNNPEILKAIEDAGATE